MDIYKPTGSLKFWCQKILPLVYDDSLSYYEVLCKVVNLLNQVIENVNGLPEYIAELISEDMLKEIMSTLLNQLEEQIASANEGNSETATADRSVGELVWLKGELYRVTKDMDNGDRYVIGSNIEKITVEETINNIKTSISTIIEMIDNLDTKIDNEINARETAIANEIIARENADNSLANEIAKLKLVYNVMDYGAKGDGTTDDTQAFIDAINAAGNLDVVYAPGNHTYKITSGIIIDKPIKFICLGTLKYASLNGACVTVSPNANKSLDNSYIYISNLGVASGYGNTAQPSSVNANGNIGIKVNRLISSKIEIGRITGFTYCGMLLNGRGDISGGNEIILHDYIYVNTIANCGYGLYMISKDAATDCVEANEFHLVWLLQCYDCIRIDNDSPNYVASTSNYFVITAVDNAENHGIECNSKWNIFEVAFMSTNFVFGNQSESNTLRIGNNFGTDASVTDFGVNNRYSTAMPNANILPARITPTTGETLQNNNGVPIDCYLQVYATESGTDGIVDINIGRASDAMLGCIKEIISGDTTASKRTTIHFRVPSGWYYRIGVSNVTAQYISYLPE